MRKRLFFILLLILLTSCLLGCESPVGGRGVRSSVSESTKLSYFVRGGNIVVHFHCGTADTNRNCTDLYDDRVDECEFLEGEAFALVTYGESTLNYECAKGHLTDIEGYYVTLLKVVYPLAGASLPDQLTVVSDVIPRRFHAKQGDTAVVALTKGLGGFWYVTGNVFVALDDAKVGMTQDDYESYPVDLPSDVGKLQKMLLSGFDSPRKNRCLLESDEYQVGDKMNRYRRDPSSVGMLCALGDEQVTIDGVGLFNNDREED